MRKLVLIFVFLLLLVGVANAGDHHNRDGDYPYVVQPGDTITGIANAFHVDPDNILIRNNIIDPNRIRVGQVLYIPKGEPTVPREHVVQPGERLTDIAIRYKVDLNALIEVNHLGNPDRILPGQVIIIPSKGGPADYPRAYRVDRGDTLASIGAKFGVSWQQLAAYNNIWNPNYIQAGMLIQIPPSDYNSYDHSYDNYSYTDYSNNYHADNNHGNNNNSNDGYQSDSYGKNDGNVYQYDNYHYPTQHYPLTYIVKQGDVLEFIAGYFGVTVEAIREFNDLEKWDPIFPGQVLLIPMQGSPTHHHQPPARHNGGDWYTVRRGDTLSGIAAYFHVSIYKLAKANDIHNWNSIYAGQVLFIPNEG